MFLLAPRGRKWAFFSLFTFGPGLYVLLINRRIFHWGLRLGTGRGRVTSIMFSLRGETLAEGLNVREQRIKRKRGRDKAGWERGSFNVIQRVRTMHGSASYRASTQWISLKHFVSRENCGSRSLLVFSLRFFSLCFPILFFSSNATSAENPISRKNAHRLFASKRTRLSPPDFCL